jgi:hypothetical protein
MHRFRRPLLTALPLLTVIALGCALMLGAR